MPVDPAQYLAFRRITLVSALLADADAVTVIIARAVGSVQRDYVLCFATALEQRPGSVRAVLGQRSGGFGTVVLGNVQLRARYPDPQVSIVQSPSSSPARVKLSSSIDRHTSATTSSLVRRRADGSWRRP